MFQAQNRETKLLLEMLLCPPRSLWRRAWQDYISQHNTKPARPRPIFWVSDLVLRPTVSDHITGLGSLVMLFDVFQYIRLNSQSESGRWSSLQGRGEVDGGGIRHLEESPQGVPD